MIAPDAVEHEEYPPRTENRFQVAAIGGRARGVDAQTRRMRPCGGGTASVFRAGGLGVDVRCLSGWTRTKAAFDSIDELGCVGERLAAIEPHDAIRKR